MSHEVLHLMQCQAFHDYIRRKMYGLLVELKEVW